MTRMIFGAPRVAPAKISPWVGTRMYWTGWDGVRRELTDWRSGVFVLEEGVEGLSMPKHTAWTSSSPAQHGQRLRGFRVPARPCAWASFVYSKESSLEFLERDGDFWHSLQPGKYGTWEVRTEAGTRRIRCRLDDESGGDKYGLDPSQQGWAAYDIRLIADDPFWYGETVEAEWGTASLVDFNAWVTDSQMGYLSSANRLENAVMTNPGDVEAWPVWTISGPATSVTVGITGSTVTAPINLASSSDVLVIDTDPAVQMAWLNGVDVTMQLGSADFAPIPAGADRKLVLAMTGNGTVSATISTRYYRAWG